MMTWFQILKSDYHLSRMRERFLCSDCWGNSNRFPLEWVLKDLKISISQAGSKDGLMDRWETGVINKTARNSKWRSSHQWFNGFIATVLRCFLGVGLNNQLHWICVELAELIDNSFQVITRFEKDLKRYALCVFFWKGFEGDYLVEQWYCASWVLLIHIRGRTSQ